MQLGQLLDDLLNDARDPPADETRKDQTAAPAPAPATDGAAPTPAADGAALYLPQAGAGAMKVKILKCDNCKVAYEICLPGAGGGGGGSSSSEGTTAAALPPTATPADAPAASPGSAEEGGGGGGVEPG